jgi:hypothetical protein
MSKPGRISGTAAGLSLPSKLAQPEISAAQVSTSNNLHGLLWSPKFFICGLLHFVELERSIAFVPLENGQSREWAGNCQTNIAVIGLTLLAFAPDVKARTH